MAAVCGGGSSSSDESDNDFNGTKPPAVKRPCLDVLQAANDSDDDGKSISLSPCYSGTGVI